MGASGPRADSQETSASKGVRRPEPNQGILKLRRFTSVIPPRSDSLLLFPLLFRNKRDGSALLSRSDRALKGISSASHSPVQRDPNYLNADNYSKLVEVISSRPCSTSSFHASLFVSRGAVLSPAHLHLGDQYLLLEGERRFSRFH